jgi:hypothetical protein
LQYPYILKSRIVILIHDMACLSPQKTFPHAMPEELMLSSGNQLRVIEAVYEGIPPGVLRRMGKAVRLGVGAGLAVLKGLDQPDGIVIGTGNGGIEDCIRFLDQIIEYSEGLLTPGNFVQSTANAIGSQISLIKKNTRYSCTHVHRGLAFENALLDTILLLQENPSRQYLTGAVDEISMPNYNIDLLAGWFSKEIFSNSLLFEKHPAATIAGEGAFMGIFDKRPLGAVAALEGLQFFHSEDPALITWQLTRFLRRYLSSGGSVDLLVSGEDGDSRHLPFYTEVERLLPGSLVARFKHLSGEYPTASSFGFWLSCQILRQQQVPAICLKTGHPAGSIKNILLYNNYRGLQHAFYLIRRVEN